MKKILFLLSMVVLIGVTIPAKAQIAFRYTTANPTGAFTNTAADTMSYTLSKSYKQVTIQPVFTKASGTMAGTAVLYSSVNGTNYVSTGDTITNTNQTTNTTVWTKISAARYWRIVRSGATTVTGTSAAKFSATN